MSANLVQHKIRKRFFVDSVSGTRAGTGRRIAGAAVGNVTFGYTVLCQVYLSIPLKRSIAVGAYEFAGEQEGLRRGTVGSEQGSFSIDCLHCRPYFWGDDSLVCPFMPHPFGFRFADHGAVLVGTSAGPVLDENAGIAFIGKHVFHRSIPPELRIPGV